MKAFYERREAKERLHPRDEHSRADRHGRSICAQGGVGHLSATSSLKLCRSLAAQRARIGRLPSGLDALPKP
jgi:hypothetical protein